MRGVESELVVIATNMAKHITSEAIHPLPAHADSAVVPQYDDIECESEYPAHTDDIDEIEDD